MSEEASVSRRRFLAVATSVTGAVGLAMTAAPFIASFRPSARAQALGAPVEVDVSKLEAGAMVRVQWRGQPVWILRRDPDMLARLGP
ncbi:MAG: ubiquinol-cytochrome c reductase iron-sulfur subunit, partial [Gammaproteobacteria bacterium]|nr:ubiquinol-cytochrome c reductase iron-sulfur subunit [Gammaproteobacteria bacterium]